MNISMCTAPLGMRKGEFIVTEICTVCGHPIYEFHICNVCGWSTLTDIIAHPTLMDVDGKALQELALDIKAKAWKPVLKALESYVSYQIEKEKAEKVEYNTARALFIKRDYAKAAALFRKIGTDDRHYGDAQNNLGVCYEHGLGAEKDLKKAYNHYTNATRNGSRLGFLNLQRCYQNRIDDSKDQHNTAVKAL